MSGRRDGPVLDDLRRRARRIWEAALDAADPAAAVGRALDQRPLQGDGGWELLAIGKAAGAMARAAVERAGAGLRRVLVVTESRQVEAVESALAEALGTGPANRLRVLAGGHPLPDRDSERAGRAAEELVRGSRAPLLVLLSGGGSALLCAPASGEPAAGGPAEGLTLADLVETTIRIQAAGADVHQLNCVRRHLSRVKGGRLGRRAAGREVRVLVLSDVLGDRLEDVASGPFYGDPTRYADALEVCRDLGVAARLPEAVVRRLEAGARGELDENPAPAELRGVEHEVVGSLARSVEAAMARAVELGCEASRLPGWITGEARAAGAELCARVLADSGLSGSGRSGRLPAGGAFAGASASVTAGDDRSPPLALIGGGETVVTVTGEGIGGRAQELALGFAGAAAGRIARLWALLAAGTDGRDGPGEAAGALVDAQTLERARARSVDLQEVLERNDASRLLRATGDLLVTGPTGTNVGDVVILLLAGERASGR